MKIKIIDILNKIANGEEVPNKIKIGDIIWTYEDNDYINKELATGYIDSNKRYLLGYYNFNVLNDEVEILDDNYIFEETIGFLKNIYEYIKSQPSSKEEKERIKKMFEDFDETLGVKENE